MAFAPTPALLKKRTTKVLDPLTLGERHARRGQHEMAVQQFTVYLDRAGKSDPYAYVARGSSAQALGNHVRASYDFSMAIRLDPSTSSHYTSRGISFAALGQLETSPGALHDHDSALRLLQCGSSPLPRHLANAHIERGKARERADRMSRLVRRVGACMVTFVSVLIAAEAARIGVCCDGWLYWTVLCPLWTLGLVARLLWSFFQIDAFKPSDSQATVSPCACLLKMKPPTRTAPPEAADGDPKIVADLSKKVATAYVVSKKSAKLSDSKDFKKNKKSACAIM